MVGTYNRNKAKREHQEIAIEQITSHKEVIMAKEMELQAQEEDLVRRLEEQGYPLFIMTGKDIGDMHDALDRAQGKRVRPRYEMDHRGQLIDLEESHHALVDDAERDLRGRRVLLEYDPLQPTTEQVDKVLSIMPCSACLLEHHPSADCPADDDVRRHNESQQDPRDLDMYHPDDFY